MMLSRGVQEPQAGTERAAAGVLPFRISIPAAELEALRSRLAATRWPRSLPGSAWSRGIPPERVMELAEYWRAGFDWGAQEERLNAIPQCTTEIDGQRIHFFHVRSPEPEAVPLLLLHGWPGSPVEFLRVIGPLSDPCSHGGAPDDAFHLVIPSAPGFGFSQPLAGEAWSHRRIAAAYASLMDRLGYRRFGVQGGDAGAFQAPLIARHAPDRVLGVHLNALVTFPPSDPTEMRDLTEDERERLARLQRFRQEQMGYVHIQGTRPQTVGFCLADSPAAQLAWIAEKFHEWSDPDTSFPWEGDDRDLLLTNVSLYWFTNSGGTSANLYFEAQHDAEAWVPGPRGTVPTGVLVSRRSDVTIRRFAERGHEVVHWTELSSGGHFAAMEVPGPFVSDVRTFFRRIRETVAEL